MKKIITYLCSCALLANLGITSVSAQETKQEAIFVFSGQDDYTEIPLQEDTRIEFEVDPQAGKKIIGTVYHYLNFQTAIASGDINSQMSCGLPGIQMLSNNMSNDISLFMDGDPWHYDKQLDYWGEQYIRASWPWNLFYNNVIPNANLVINCIQETETLESRATLGQALALRALSYFYLAQFYQHPYITSQDEPCVPLLLTYSMDYNDNNARATVKQVYAQIEKDLLSAIDYLDGWERNSKMQVDKQVAQGILSRVYLVMHKWEEAAELARAARQGYSLMTATEAVDYNYQDVNNKEVMWGVDITSETTMIYASFQSWMCAQDYGYGGSVGAFQLIDAKLYNSIPNNDARKQLYVAPGYGYYYDGWEIPPYGNLKFKKNGAEDWLGDYIYMRAAEMYLTEAEALVCLGRTKEAKKVLAEFMAHRLYSGTWTGNATFEEVQKQRRIELWGEGHSYFDHRRWQMDMYRGYKGSNENITAYPLQYDHGYVPWWHYSWRFQLPRLRVEEFGLEQNPIDEAGNQDPIQDKISFFKHQIEFNESALSFNPSGGTISVELIACDGYKITMPDWIQLVEDPATTHTYHSIATLHFVATENTTEAARTGEIVVSSGDGCGKSATLKVQQQNSMAGQVLQYQGQLASLVYGDVYDTTITLVWDEEDPTLVYVCDLEPYYAAAGRNIENGENFIAALYSSESNYIGIYSLSYFNINDYMFIATSFDENAENLLGYGLLEFNDDMSEVTLPSFYTAYYTAEGDLGADDLYSPTSTFKLVSRQHTKTMKMPTLKPSKVKSDTANLKEKVMGKLTMSNKRKK